MAGPAPRCGETVGSSPGAPRVDSLSVHMGWMSSDYTTSTFLDDCNLQPWASHSMFVITSLLGLALHRRCSFPFLDYFVLIFFALINDFYFVLMFYVHLILGALVPRRMTSVGVFVFGVATACGVAEPVSTCRLGRTRPRRWHPPARANLSPR